MSAAIEALDDFAAALESFALETQAEQEASISDLAAAQGKVQIGPLDV